MTIDQARGWRTLSYTGVLVLGSGEIIQGHGLGAVGEAVGEVCFNTAMTGYQEILTDPSYAGQILTFTFPHIGNVGTNDEDIETVDLDQSAGAVGAISSRRGPQPVTISVSSAAAASRAAADGALTVVARTLFKFLTNHRDRSIISDGARRAELSCRPPAAGGATK